MTIELGQYSEQAGGFPGSTSGKRTSNGTCGSAIGDEFRSTFDPPFAIASNCGVAVNVRRMRFVRPG
jgi:hypothetical protein